MLSNFIKACERSFVQIIWGSTHYCNEILVQSTVMQIEKALIKDRLRQITWNLLLRSSLLFNSFFSLFCL